MRNILKLQIAKNLLAVILCLCSPYAIAQVHEFILGNGLKLLVKEDHRAPVVVSQVWYKVGSSYEHDGITGISHALEHMMFKGTRKYGEGEFSRIIAENGGNENAFTGSDYTAYFQTLEKSRLHISFELEADRMRNLALSTDAFSREIEVVKEERRLRIADNPNAYMREVAMATAFQTSPYRQPIVGWMADLESMQVEQVRTWYRSWYAPDNATVIIVGDVSAGEVYKLAEKYFGALKPGLAASPAGRMEIPQSGIKRVVVNRPAEIPGLMMAYKVPALKSSLAENNGSESWEPYALEVLSGILSGGESARFASRLVRGAEIAADVSSDYNLTGRMDGLFTVTGIPAQGRTVAELEMAIKGQIEDLQKNPVENEELQRVKAQVVASEVYERDSAFFQGMIMGIYETVGLGWQQADKYVPEIEDITPGQVQQVARKYLIEDGVTIATLNPLPLGGGE